VNFKKFVVPVFAILIVVSIFAFSLFDSMMSDAEASGFAMGSPVTIKIYGEKNGDNLCASAIERIKFIDNAYLSHTISTSAVSTLNKNGELTADKWFADYLTKCVELSDESDRFTLFSGEMKDLWQIENGGYIPTDAEVAKTLLNLKNYSLTIKSNSLWLNNSSLDLGALGKGTACDEAIEYLKTQDVENALVTVGGSVGVIGEDSYTIGIRNPFGGQNDYFAILNVANCFVSTSGDYEKYFERDGIRYSHIFDATTGKPVQNDITSVTIVAESGTISDFLSTAVFAEGVEKGLELADEFQAEVIIVKKDKSVLISDGLKDKITINDDSFSVIE
jgi:thiamine biosynthesis lipoprotein